MTNAGKSAFLVVLINEETTKSLERFDATILTIETNPGCEIHVKRNPHFNKEILETIELHHTGKLVVFNATAIC